MKCAVYTRVSTDKEEQKQSLINQKELFTNYIKEKNWDLFDFYVDVQSGTTAKRTDLKRLINDATEKKFDIILAKELSRLARNGKLSYELKDLCQKNNIHMITLDNAINTLEEKTNMFGIYAWLYENESQTTSNRVKAALDSRARSGKMKGSHAPFGYFKDASGKLIPKNDFTFDAVKRIFKEYLSGTGYEAIARDLIRDKIPTPSQVSGKINFGVTWHGSTVRLILTNRAYIGDLVQSKETTVSVTTKKRRKNKVEDLIIVPNNHEPIILKEDFELVQEILKSRKTIKPKQQFHLFSNTLFCSDCGKGMHYRANRRGYVCGNYDKRGIIACTSHIVREAELVDLIKNDINTLLKQFRNTNIEDKLNKTLEKEKRKLINSISSIEKDIEKLNINKNKALGKLIEELISKSDYDFYILDINNKISQLDSSLLGHKNKLSKLESNNHLKSLEDLSQAYLKIDELTSEILNRFIERIEIKEDGSPRIFYRFSVTP